MFITKSHKYKIFGTLLLLLLLSVSLLACKSDSKKGSAEAPADTENTPAATTEIPPETPEVPSETTEVPQATAKPSQTSITKADITKVLDNFDSQAVWREFEFQTSAYKTKGNLVGFGKTPTTLKINGRVSLQLSSDRNIVLDNSERIIAISMGQITTETELDMPEKWKLIAVHEKDQTDLDKLQEKLAAFAKKDDTSIFDKKVKAKIQEEIKEEKQEQETSKAQIFQEETRAKIETQLTTRYDISDYTIKIIFD
ncbi:hypothetical protein FACS1894111_09760 [Clostridia bacterium]|nr:hypothetical protein FACS1894111_09760 [Clostridia bacterium]